MNLPGTLYLVATPIGNLQDMSFRAIEVLRSVDLIACEDTRHTRKLLNHFGIKNSVVSYHEHNEIGRAAELSVQLAEGRSIAVVSDAGTPGICDPSFRLVQKAVEIGATVVPIPGPVAFINAAAASGLPTDALYFGGFLPSKAGDRRRRLEEVRDIPATLVFYEAPHRLTKALADCLELLGDRDAAVARELTKIHEEIVRGTLGSLVQQYEHASVKGEIVLVIDRAGPAAQAPAGSIADRFNALVDAGIDRRAALKQAAREYGLSRSEAYRWVNSVK